MLARFSYSACIGPLDQQYTSLWCLVHVKMLLYSKLFKALYAAGLLSVNSQSYMPRITAPTGKAYHAHNFEKKEGS